MESDVVALVEGVGTTKVSRWRFETGIVVRFGHVYALYVMNSIEDKYKTQKTDESWISFSYFLTTNPNDHQNQPSERDNKRNETSFEESLPSALTLLEKCYWPFLFKFLLNSTIKHTMHDSCHTDHIHHLK